MTSLGVLDNRHKYDDDGQVLEYMGPCGTLGSQFHIVGTHPRLEPSCSFFAYNLKFGSLFHEPLLWTFGG